MAIHFQQTTWGTESHAARFQLQCETGYLCNTAMQEGEKLLNQKCSTAEEIHQHIFINPLLWSSLTPTAPKPNYSPTAPRSKGMIKTGAHTFSSTEQSSIW